MWVKIKRISLCMHYSKRPTLTFSMVCGNKLGLKPDIRMANGFKFRKLPFKKLKVCLRGNITTRLLRECLLITMELLLILRIYRLFSQESRPFTFIITNRRKILQYGETSKTAKFLKMLSYMRAYGLGLTMTTMKILQWTQIGPQTRLQWQIWISITFVF